MEAASMRGGPSGSRSSARRQLERGTHLPAQGVTHRGSESIRRIGSDRTVEPQNTAHHELHLSLLGAAGSDHRQLDLAGRVFEYLGVRIRRAADRRAARLAELERAIDVAVHENPLDGDLLRPVLADDAAHAAEDLPEPRR